MEPKKKLKQLHWIKVHERKVANTIWEKMRDEDVQLPFDEIEELFQTKAVAKVGAKAGDAGGAGAEEEGEELPGGGRKKKVVILLSANRSQTIGVLLSHLKIPHEDFRRAIMSLDTRTLQPNFVVQVTGSMCVYVRAWEALSFCLCLGGGSGVSCCLCLKYRHHPCVRECVCVCVCVCDKQELSYIPGLCLSPRIILHTLIVSESIFTPLFSASGSVAAH
jgi:hypothetical protein